VSQHPSDRQTTKPFLARNNAHQQTTMNSNISSQQLADVTDHHGDYPDLPVQLREICARIAYLHENNEQSQLRAAYEIGQSISKVCSDPDRYGKAAAEKIALTLDLEPQYLYRCKRVSEAFSPEVFQELCDRRNGGYFLTLTHFAILKLLPAKAQAQMIERAFEERLSTRALHEEVQQLVGGHTPKQQEPQEPRTPFIALQRLTSMQAEFLRRSHLLEDRLSRDVELIDKRRWGEHQSLYSDALAGAKLLLQQAEHNVRLLEQAKVVLDKKMDEARRRDQTPQVPARPKRQSKRAA
jgi:hypothetical protein